MAGVPCFSDSRVITCYGVRVCVYTAISALSPLLYRESEAGFN